MPPLSITEFTDPACPFAFSAEPHRLRLRWLYGEQLTWNVRMVGLAETRAHYTDKGLTPEALAEGGRQLAERFGMPIDTTVKTSVTATVPACRAVVAARVHAPELAEPLLRRLRVRALSTPGLLDDPALIAAAAQDVGIAELDAWLTDPAVETALAEDLRLARDPSPAALALPDKLAEDDGVWRYTCPSYEVGNGRSLSVPGMQSSLAYEVAVANLAPDLERRPEPEDPGEVLAWAGFPLATQEVAEVMGVGRDTARERLEQAGATEAPAGTDAFWTV